MNNKQNLNFESTRIKVPESSKEDTQVDSVESVRVDLENSLAIDDQDEPASSARSLPLRDKFSGLNTKLSSYLERIKKSERRLAESVQKVKRLEEANRVLKEDSREQLEFLRLQLDEQIRKTVLAENQRAEAEERLETCTKHSSQVRSELETQKARAGELEESLNVERRRSKEALGELVSLREQMLQERTEYNEQKQQMMNLKIDYAKLQERFKINTAELTFSQSRLGELQNQTHFTADEVQKKLSDLKQRLEKKFSDTMTEKLREKRNEIKRLQDELQNKLQSVLQTSIAVEDFELLKTQLEEQQRRAEAAATEAADWRQKFHESESELKRAGNEYAKQLEEERRRRKELNKRLLAQSKAQDEVRQELENYRKLIEGLDQGGSYSAECLSFVTTPEGVAGSPLFLGSPLGRLQLPGGTPNLPEARTRLLRKAVTPKKTSSTAESESLIQVMNDGRHQPQET